MDDRSILQRYLDNAIPQVGAMSVTVHEADDILVVLDAPLAPNINHQKTAFGGSVASIATLACWGWLWNHLREPGSETVLAQLVVARAEVDYLRPIATGMQATCAAPDEAALDAFHSAFERRGRGRLQLSADIRDEQGVVCAHFVGRFVAVKP